MVPGRSQVDASVSVDASQVLVKATTRGMCSPARMGKMRTVSARQVGVGTGARVLWGVGSLAMLAGSVGLGASWASTPDHPVNLDLIGSLGLAAGAIAGFVTWPGLVSKPYVEGKDALGAPVAKWNGDEAPCDDDLSRPLSGRKVVLTVSVGGAERLEYQRTTNDAGDAAIPAVQDLRTLVKWCGAAEMKIRLDQQSLTAEDRGEAIEPARGEIKLGVKTRAAPGTRGDTAGTHAQLRNISDSRVKQLARECANEEQRACVRSHESDSAGWRKQCRADCLRGLDVEVVETRFNLCMKTESAEVCEKALERNLESLGTPYAKLTQCQTTCESKAREGVCPAPVE